MTERPMLFSAPMVRAILAGTKCQTRRVVKLPKWVAAQGGDLRAETTFKDCGFGDGEYLHVAVDDGSVQRVYCPYADTPGDRLWGRETFAPQADCEIGYKKFTSLKLTPGAKERPIIHYAADASYWAWVQRWRPSIHMPRWASRINLEVTGVRVERLQSISAKDILAEGAVERTHDDQFGHNPVSRFDGKVYLDLQSLWAYGWDSINGLGSWAANPWVWVIEFRRVGT